MHEEHTWEKSKLIPYFAELWGYQSVLQLISWLFSCYYSGVNISYMGNLLQHDDSLIEHLHCWH